MKTKKSSVHKNRKPLLILFGILVIVVIIIFNMMAQREKALKVTLEKVEKQNLTSLISASGEIKPKKNINISAHIPGRIIKIGVEEGQRVNRDDFLLKLDSTQYEAYADRDRAQIQALKADRIRPKPFSREMRNFSIVRKSSLKKSSSPMNSWKLHRRSMTFPTLRTKPFSSRSSRPKPP